MADPALAVYAANDIVNVQVLGKLYGDWNMISLHWRWKQTAEFNGGPRQHLQNFCTALASNVSVHQVWQKFRHRRVYPGTVTEYGEFIWAGTTGANPEHALPAQLAAVWRIHTEHPWPSGQGRFFLPGVPMDHWSNNNWTLLAHSVKDGLRGQLESGFKQNGGSEWLELGVFTRVPHDWTFAPMLTMSYASYPGVQRSRRPETMGA